ncbi:hypothetical protein H6P81_012427 [Aristolochia fimbriata]|uniref:Uncharacterized protein n=1 Tax=Aristolochia fimbriata TaxID=158543 RepID=A0AAV7EC54_ARIFI|nr:hypothetical protein H6P81_012427 [Aristolochia fimbriata]
MPPKRLRRTEPAHPPENSSDDRGLEVVNLQDVSPMVVSEDETQDPTSVSPTIETVRRRRGPTTGLSLKPPPGQKWVYEVKDGQPLGEEGGALGHRLGVFSQTWSYFPLDKQWEELQPGVFDDILQKIKIKDEGTLVMDVEVMVICKRSLCTKRLTQSEWECLKAYWEKPEFIKLSARNKANNAHSQATHTLGSKSITRHYEDEVKVVDTFELAKLQNSKDTHDVPPILDQVFGRHHGGFERGMGSGYEEHIGTQPPKT